MFPGITRDARDTKLEPALADTAVAVSRLGKVVLPTGETRVGEPACPRSVDDYADMSAGTSVY